jgi:hypothetical protein
MDAISKFRGNPNFESGGEIASEIEQAEAHHPETVGIGISA